MSALRGARQQLFELHPSGSFREQPSIKHKYALEEHDGAAANSEAIPEESDFEEEEVDESVREEIKKLEDTFPGISDRFRLVNRIGEGEIASSALLGSLWAY